MCEECNTKLTKPTQTKFCSRKCSAIFNQKKNPKRGNIWYDKDGYAIKEHKRVHRIVYEQHYGTIPLGYEIDHINGDRLDNRIENLQALTREEHLYKSGQKKHYEELVQAMQTFMASDVKKTKCNFMKMKLGVHVATIERRMGGWNNAKKLI